MSFVALHQTLEALGAFNTLSHFQKARTELEKKEWIRKRLTEHSLSHVVPLYEQLIELRCLVKDDKIADVDAVFDPLNQGVTNCRFNPLLAKAFAVFHTFVDPKSNSETGQVLENSMTTVSTIIDDNRQVEFLLQMEHLDEVDRVLVPGIQTAVDVASNDQEATAPESYSELVHRYIANMRQSDEIGHIGAEVATYLEANPGNVLSPPKSFLDLFPRHGITKPSDTFASWKVALEELAQRFPIIFWQSVVDESANSLSQPVILPENIYVSSSVSEPEPSASSSSGPTLLPMPRVIRVGDLDQYAVSPALVEYVKRVHEGVLRIKTPKGTGSGMHWGNGWVLTNTHVLCGKNHLDPSVDMSTISIEVLDIDSNVIETFGGHHRLAFVVDLGLGDRYSDLAMIKLGPQLEYGRPEEAWHQWEKEEREKISKLPALVGESIRHKATLAADDQMIVDAQDGNGVALQRHIASFVAAALSAPVFPIHYGNGTPGLPKQISEPGTVTHHTPWTHFNHTSHTRPGSSGSPVFVGPLPQDGSYALLGVTQSGNIADDRDNTALFFFSFEPLVRSLMHKYGRLAALKDLAKSNAGVRDLVAPHIEQAQRVLTAVEANHNVYVLPPWGCMA